MNCNFDDLKYDLNDSNNAEQEIPVIDVPLINQLDGNITIDSCDDSNTETEESFLSSITFCEDFNLWKILFNSHLNDSETIQDDQTIPVIVGNRPAVAASSIPRTNSRVTIRRDNRTLLALSLPSIFVTNHRSFFPKCKNFLDEMFELNMQLGLHSEIWEDKENKNHQHMIEEAFELQGVRYISNPRKNRRGGGAAITLIEKDFLLSELDVSVQGVQK